MTLARILVLLLFVATVLFPLSVLIAVSVAFAVRSIFASEVSRGMSYFNGYTPPARRRVMKFLNGHRFQVGLSTLLYYCHVMQLVSSDMELTAATSQWQSPQQQQKSESNQSKARTHTKENILIYQSGSLAIT